MDYVAFKTKAKADIAGKVGILFLITLVIGVITGLASLLLSLVPMGSLVVSIVVTPAFALSIATVYLGVARGKTPILEDAFGGFRDFFAAFKVNFFVGLFTFLWSLLFFIPGIIKGISYSMSIYILAEDPKKNAMDCIRESTEMMEGKKMDYFLMTLSFIGWGILILLSFGIVGIWAIPYMSATYANFYLANKKETPEDTVVDDVPPVLPEGDLPSNNAEIMVEPAACEVPVEDAVSAMPAEEAEVATDNVPDDSQTKEEEKPAVGSDAYWNTIL